MYSKLFLSVASLVSVSAADSQYCNKAKSLCISASKQGADICFTMQSNVNGWVGLGIGSSKMENSDIYVGWKDGKGGYTISNQKGTGQSTPQVNPSQTAKVVPIVDAKPGFTGLSFTFCKTGLQITPTTEFILAESDKAPTGNLDTPNASYSIHTSKESFKFDFTPALNAAPAPGPPPSASPGTPPGPPSGTNQPPNKPVEVTSSAPSAAPSHPSDPMVTGNLPAPSIEAGNGYLPGFPSSSPPPSPANPPQNGAENSAAPLPPPQQPQPQQPQPQEPQQPQQPQGSPDASAAGEMGGYLPPLILPPGPEKPPSSQAPLPDAKSPENPPVVAEKPSSPPVVAEKPSSPPVVVDKEPAPPIIADKAPVMEDFPPAIPPITKEKAPDQPSKAPTKQPPPKKGHSNPALPIMVPVMVSITSSSRSSVPTPVQGKPITTSDPSLFPPPVHPPTQVLDLPETDAILDMSDKDDDNKKDEKESQQMKESKNKGDIKITNQGPISSDAIDDIYGWNGLEDPIVKLSPGPVLPPTRSRFGRLPEGFEKKKIVVVLLEAKSDE